MKTIENQTLVERLRNRASIRRNIKDRKSVQEGKPDRIADLLDESAEELTRLQSANTDMLKALQAAFKVIGNLSPTKENVLAGYTVHEALEKHGGK